MALSLIQMSWMNRWHIIFTEYRQYVILKEWEKVIDVINRGAEYNNKEKSKNLNFGYLGLNSKQL